MKPHLKILYVHEPAGGGSLVALYELINNLDKEIVIPYVICYFKNEYSKKLENIPGCTVFYLYENGHAAKNDGVATGIHHSRINNYLSGQMTALKKYYFADKEEVRKIAAIIREIKPAIVHHNNGLFVNRSSIRAASKFNIPQVMHTRGAWNYRKKSFPFLVDNYLSGKISKWIFYANEFKDYNKKLFHLKADSLYVLNDLVNYNIFHEMPADKALQAELNGNDGDYIITSPGRIIEWKGQHILLEAINQIKEKIRPFKLLIVGPDELGIGSKTYLNQLKKLAVEYGIENEVVFTGNRDDMPAIINLSDLIVHSSIKPEPQGLVILEALFCKKKVIATNAGGAADLVQKYGGKLVQPGDTGDLAKAILKAFEDRNIPRTKVDEMQFEKLKSDFDTGKKIGEIMELYGSILSGLK